MSKIMSYKMTLDEEAAEEFEQLEAENKELRDILLMHHGLHSVMRGDEYKETKLYDLTNQALKKAG